MAKRVGVDKWLFGVTVLLVFIGLLMVFSASAVMAEDRYGSPYIFVSRQVGVGGPRSGRHDPSDAHRLPQIQPPHRGLSRRCRYHSAVAGRLSLARLAQHPPLDPLRRLFSFQPSEIAKPVLVLFLAWFLQDKLHSIRDWRNTLLPAALPSARVSSCSSSRSPTWAPRWSAPR